MQKHKVTQGICPKNFYRGDRGGKLLMRLEAVISAGYQRKQRMAADDSILAFAPLNFVTYTSGLTYNP
jgi:hypothetical protein